MACDLRTLASDPADSSIWSGVVAWFHYSPTQRVTSRFKVERKFFAIRKFYIEEASWWTQCSECI